ncbi:MAG: major capsid protein [Gammaproteobacteria bacterium]|nr:major capsid protein [Gammaproteobacteria bacterium]
MDLFSTDVLTGLVRNPNNMPQTWLLDMFFPNVQTETSEEIHFDVEDEDISLAPFVSPLVEGQIVVEKGFTTKTFKPAYLKPKTPLDPTRPLKRAMGEQIGGVLSPQQRLALQVRGVTEQHRNRIDRRLEVMAGQALVSGSVTVTGDKYPTTVVDFGRNAANSIAVLGGSQWGDVGVNPLDDLQDWSDIGLGNSGLGTQVVVMTVDVWKVFRNDADVKARLDTRRVAQTDMDLGAQLQYGGVYRGQIDGFLIYTYAGTYTDENGAVQKIIPDGTVIMSGPGLLGYRAFGAIYDEEAGFMALEYFAKSWVEKDPSRRIILTQSAPLVVPYRVNASVAATNVV